MCVRSKEIDVLTCIFANIHLIWHVLPSLLCYISPQTNPTWTYWVSYRDFLLYI